MLSQPLKCFQILSSSFHLNIKVGKSSCPPRTGVYMPLTEALCCPINLPLFLFASWEASISLLFLLAFCWRALSQLASCWHILTGDLAHKNSQWKESGRRGFTRSMISEHEVLNMVETHKHIFINWLRKNKGVPCFLDDLNPNSQSLVIKRSQNIQYGKICVWDSFKKFQFSK